MNQISKNVLVINPGDEIPQGNSLKIMLLGSFPANQNDPKFDWCGKFIDGLVALRNPDDPKSLLQFRGNLYTIMDPRAPVSNQEINDQNGEFVQSFNLINDWANTCDCLFFNFLSKSTATLPLYYFASFSGLGKMVVRMSDGYVNSGIVKVQCQRNNIPLLDSAHGNVFSVLQTMYAFIPAFQNMQRFQLPE